MSVLEFINEQRRGLAWYWMQMWDWLKEALQVLPAVILAVVPLYVQTTRERRRREERERLAAQEKLRREDDDARRRFEWYEKRHNDDREEVHYWRGETNTANGKVSVLTMDRSNQEKENTDLKIKAAMLETELAKTREELGRVRQELAKYTAGPG